MELIKWSEQYYTNIDEIDNQHKYLVHLINQLYKGINKSLQKEILESILFELIKYTLIHFSTEEELMKKISFEDSDHHIRQHQEFTTKVTSYYSDIKDNKKDISIDLLKFLNAWLINHILVMDKMLANTIIMKDIDV